MGYQDAEEKERAGDTDERKKEIYELSETGVFEWSDGAEVDQEAEAQAEEKKKRFNHDPDCISGPGCCQSGMEKRIDSNSMLLLSDVPKVL
jgi:hypothetical protein